MRVLFAVLLSSLLLAACGREEPAKPEARPEDKVLKEHVQKQLDKAKEVEKLLEQDKQRLDDAIEGKTEDDSSEQP
ncbi:MAG: hypothetical protein HYV16_00675 [Gammaproteobacteria bacterium]|nr:hypothetical protein [Gammaproteobacteria bacterium]